MSNKAKLDPKVLLKKAGSYLKEHPDEILRALRSALGLRIGIPMDALRFAAREFVVGKKAPKDVVIEASPPGLRLSATVDAMGTPLRASLILYVEQIELTTDTLKLVVRINDLSLDVLGEANSPIAGLLKSGALDLSKPGNLVAFMPKRPPALVDAKDDRLTVDLMKVPKVAEDLRLRKALQITTPVLGVAGISTEDDHLDIQLRADLNGVPAAVAAIRALS